MGDALASDRWDAKHKQLSGRCFAISMLCRAPVASTKWRSSSAAPPSRTQRTKHLPARLLRSEEVYLSEGDSAVLDMPSSEEELDANVHGDAAAELGGPHEASEDFSEAEEGGSTHRKPFVDARASTGSDLSCCASHGSSDGCRGWGVLQRRRLCTHAPLIARTALEPAVYR